jgi:hypothetical protein
MYQLCCVIGAAASLQNKIFIARPDTAWDSIQPLWRRACWLVFQLGRSAVRVACGLRCGGHQSLWRLTNKLSAGTAVSALQPAQNLALHSGAPGKTRGSKTVHSHFPDDSGVLQNQ